jgi:NitT/TauT family transport system substrate-binding protein
MRALWQSPVQRRLRWVLVLAAILLALPGPAAGAAGGRGVPAAVEAPAAPGVSAAVAVPAAVEAASAAAPPARSAASAADVTAAQGLTPVRVAMQYLISDSGLLIADAFGYMRDVGIDFQAQRVDNIQLQAAMAAGQIDVGGIGVTAATLNAALRGVNLRIVADRATIIPGHSYLGLVVRTDLIESGQVQTVRDLRGRKIAPQPPLYGSGSWALLARLFEMEGLPEADVEFEPLGFADQNAGLANRSVDAILQNEPGVAAAVESGFGVRFRGFDDVLTPFTLGGMAYSEQFAAQTDLARRFMVAYVRGVRAYLDAFERNQGRAEVVAVLARETALKDPAAYDRVVMPWIHPDGQFGLNGYDYVQGYFVRHGLIPRAVDLTQFVDNRFSEYAAQTLGPYR